MEKMQDVRLHEFGDLIIKENNRELFIHISDRKEVIECVEQGGLEVIENIWQRDLAEETEIVKQYVKQCKFWAVRRSKV